MSEGMRVDIPKDEVGQVFQENQGAAVPPPKKKAMGDVWATVARWKWLVFTGCCIALFIMYELVKNQHTDAGEAKVGGDPGVVASAAGDRTSLQQQGSPEVQQVARQAEEEDKKNPTYVAGLPSQLAEAVDNQRKKSDPSPSTDQSLGKIAESDANSVPQSGGSPSSGTETGLKAETLDKLLDKVAKRREPASGFVQFSAENSGEKGSGDGQDARHGSSDGYTRASVVGGAAVSNAAGGKYLLPSTHLYAVQASDWNSWQPGQVMEAVVMNGGVRGLKLIGKGVLSKDGVLSAEYSQYVYAYPNGVVKTGVIRAVGQGLHADERGRRNLAQGSDQHYFQRYVAPALVKFVGNLPAAQVAANTQNTQLQSIGGIGVATAPTLKDSAGSKVAYALANSGVSNIGDDMSSRMAATPPESWTTKGVEIDVTILEAVPL